MPRVAVIGSGISGLGCAWGLVESHGGYSVTVFEKEARLGGHTNTIEVPGLGPVDTGFIVFNSQTYPNFIRFLNHLAIKVRGQHSHRHF